MLGWSASEDISHIFASDKPSHSRASLVRPVASMIERLKWQWSPYYYRPSLGQCNGSTWAPKIEFGRDAQIWGHSRRVRAASYVNVGHNTSSIIRWMHWYKSWLRINSVVWCLWGKKRASISVMELSFHSLRCFSMDQAPGWLRRPGANQVREGRTIHK